MIEGRDTKIVINEDLNCYQDFLDSDWVEDTLACFEDSSPYREPVALLLHTWLALSSANGIPQSVLVNVQDVDKQGMWDQAIQSEATRRGLWLMQRVYFEHWCKAYVQFLTSLIEPASDAEKFESNFTEKFGAEAYHRCWGDPLIQFFYEVGQCLLKSGGKPSGWLADVEHSIEMQNGIFQIRTQDLRYLSATLIRAVAFLVDELDTESKPC